MSENNPWLAPAKLNLFLHITGRREDGYHELQTLFQLLDFGDLLSFEVNQTGKVRRLTKIPTVAEDQDIIIKAAKLLKQRTNCPYGVDIGIDKRIPMGGGLGGGSSDAATTLLALNHLWQLSQSRDQLAELGLSLGADVPLFVRGHTAWAEGVGELLSPVQLPERWYVVVTPEINASTAQLFADGQLTRDARPIKIRDYFYQGQEDQGQKGQAEIVGSRISELVDNAFEPVARRRFPEIAAALDYLSQQAGRKARLSGTGASVFVDTETQEIAQDLAATIPKKWRCFVAKGINESPVLKQAS